MRGAFHKQGHGRSFCNQGSTLVAKPLSTTPPIAEASSFRRNEVQTTSTQKGNPRPPGAVRGRSMASSVCDTCAVAVYLAVYIHIQKYRFIIVALLLSSLVSIIIIILLLLLLLMHKQPQPPMAAANGPAKVVKAVEILEEVVTTATSILLE